MDEKIRVALVGHFQVGKSSCLNGLLTAKKAAVGNGWRSETAACTEYLFADGVVLVDTPGFDDTGERDQMTEKAICRADCVLFVVDDQRYPDEVCVDWLWKLKGWRKPTVFLLNCRDDGNVEEPVSPADLEAFVERNGFDMFMPVAISKPSRGRRWNADPTNVGRAGVPPPATDSGGSETTMPVRGEIVLSINASWDAPRNIDVLRAYLGNIRLELLSHLARSLGDRNRLFDDLSEKFRTKFSNRYEHHFCHRVASVQ